jgi:hypothetical protein
MKVVLQDMTIEGNPEEITKFLALKEDKKSQMANQGEGNIVGTCIPNRNFTECNLSAEHVLKGKTIFGMY